MTKLPSRTQTLLLVCLAGNFDTTLAGLRKAFDPPEQLGGHDEAQERKLNGAFGFLPRGVNHIPGHHSDADVKKERIAVFDDDEPLVEPQFDTASQDNSPPQAVPTAPPIMAPDSEDMMTTAPPTEELVEPIVETTSQDSELVEPQFETSPDDTPSPTKKPTRSPTTKSPTTKSPTMSPTKTPSPTVTPSPTTTPSPTKSPTTSPAPTITPRPTSTPYPTKAPANNPTKVPTLFPQPTPSPEETPTRNTPAPSMLPSLVESPVERPTSELETEAPTLSPVSIATRSTMTIGNGISLLVAAATVFCMI